MWYTIFLCIMFAQFFYHGLNIVVFIAAPRPFKRISDNSNNFDLDFASEFNKVRPITQGNWSSNLSEVFENFRAYSLKLESFQQYIEDVRLAEETRDKKRIEELDPKIKSDSDGEDGVGDDPS